LVGRETLRTFQMVGKSGWWGGAMTIKKTAELL